MSQGILNKNFPDCPLITVVSIVFNEKMGLEKTLNSIFCQVYGNIQSIVIDGGSTDGSLDVIRKYEKDIDLWVSGDDDGIYDAMNKGIIESFGDFLMFLNAGDVLVDESVILECVNEISKFRNIEYNYFGNAIIVREDVMWKRPNVFVHGERDYYIPCHQAVFFSRLFVKENLYLAKMKICADLEYIARACSFSALKYIDVDVCYFELGGVSSSFCMNLDRVNLILEERNYIEDFYGKGSKFFKMKNMIFLYTRFVLGFVLGERFFYLFIKYKNIFFKY